jgi:hypothetical protein
MKTEIKKQPTNDDILRLATVIPQTGGKTFFRFSISYVRDYDVQKNIRDNEPRIVTEAKNILESMRESFGEGWKRNTPGVSEILNKPSTIELAKIKITEEQMREFRPNGEAFDIFELIRE